MTFWPSSTADTVVVAVNVIGYCPFAATASMLPDISNISILPVTAAVLTAVYATNRAFPVVLLISPFLIIEERDVIAEVPFI